MTEIGVGVAGLGRIGLMHARNLAHRIERARLVAVCDVDTVRADRAACELECKAYFDLAAMLEDRHVEAVVVCTPTEHHAEGIRRILRTGKPLFCEKPLAAGLEENRVLARAITEAGLTFQIGFHRRFDPAHAEARRLIEDGAIGRPVHIQCISRDPYPPPPWACDPARGGGLFIDMQLHDFDLARFLMHDEVTRVFADRTRLVVEENSIEQFADNVTTHLRFAGGALGDCHASMHAAYGYDVRAEVYGEKSRLLIGGRDWIESNPSTHGSPDCAVARPVADPRPGDEPHFMVRFREAYEREMKAFVDCVIENKRPEVNETDALAAFEIAIAALESAREGRPVEI